MTLDSKELSIPEGGETVEFDDEFRSPEAPIIPVAYGAEDEVISATQRVLSTAADLMGRDIHWLRVYTGEEARKRYGAALPRDTVQALRHFRLGLLGAPATTRKETVELEKELQQLVGLTVAIDQQSQSKWMPSMLHDGKDVDITVFRDVTRNAAGFEYNPKSEETKKLHDFLRETIGELDAIPEESTAYSVRSTSAAAIESLIHAAMEYALDRDRNTLTILHQNDILPTSDGSFLDWAHAYLADEYADATIDETTFRNEYDTGYPEDKIVVTERYMDTACRDLLIHPEEYDVLVAPGLGGIYVSAVAAAATGGNGVNPRVMLGEGRIVASAQSVLGQNGVASNPIGAILSGCLMFEYIGWDDIVNTLHDAISATLTDGILPCELCRQRVGCTSVSTDEFADAVIEKLEIVDCVHGPSGIRTTADERLRIKEIIAGLYNIVFEDQISPSYIELNQLLGEDQEADVYLPEVGLNFYYWRQWSVERRLEVLLHELAHIEERAGERDHGSEFYDRLIELTEIAAEWESELDELFGESIDFGQVRCFIVESVHEETIEFDLESVRNRKRMLREYFNLDGDEYC